MKTLLTALLLAPLAVLFAASDSWPGWLGPNRDGHSPDTGLLKQWPDGGPKLLWKVDTIGQGWSSVAVVNNRVFTSAMTQNSTATT